MASSLAFSQVYTWPAWFHMVPGISPLILRKAESPSSNHSSMASWIGSMSTQGLSPSSNPCPSPAIRLSSNI